jgi:hypothetical protein
VTRVNEKIFRVLELSRELLKIADEGDEARTDKGSGILFGTVRDNSYKLIRLAQQELEVHRNSGPWDDQDEVAYQRSASLSGSL